MATTTHSLEMEANTSYCVIDKNPVIEEIDGNYSYPYHVTSAASFADSIRPNEPYWQTTTFTDGGTATAMAPAVEPKSCDNEEDIYSYII